MSNVAICTRSVRATSHSNISNTHIQPYHTHSLTGVPLMVMCRDAFITPTPWAVNLHICGARTCAPSVKHRWSVCVAHRILHRVYYTHTSHMFAHISMICVYICCAIRECALPTSSHQQRSGGARAHTIVLCILKRSRAQIIHTRAGPARPCAHFKHRYTRSHTHWYPPLSYIYIALCECAHARVFFHTGKSRATRRANATAAALPLDPWEPQTGDIY